MEILKWIYSSSSDNRISINIKSSSTASARLFAYAPWSQTHRQNSLTGNDPFTPDLRVIAFCCTLQAEPLISTATCKTFDLDCDTDLWPWHRPLTLTSKQGKSQLTVMSKHDFEHLTFDLRPRPTIPAYSRSEFNLLAKNQGQRSGGWAMRALTNKQTHGRRDATKYIISLASRLIKTEW